MAPRPDSCRTSTSSASARGIGIVILLLHFVAETAWAQAWTPSKGEGTLGITYQNYYFTGHLDPEGQDDRNGAAHAKAVLTEFEYGVTDSLALSVSLPFIASKYTGSPAGSAFGPLVLPVGPLDDGRYHGAFQDWRFELRYRTVSTRAVSLTPFVALAVPSHRYETSGEAVPGKHRRETLVGVNGGVPFEAFLRGAYIHARYSYAVVQRVRGARLNRSNVDIEGGAAIIPRVTLRGVSAWHIAHDHGSIAFEDALHDPALWRIHDREVGASFVNAGGGVTLSLTHALDLNVLYIATVAGSAGAHAATAISFGISWGFGGGYAPIFGTR